MRSAAGQGTVEYVGVLLLAAVLLGAVAGGFGVPRLTAGIASSITRALLGAIGVAAPGPVTASASERAAFAHATDATVAADDRSSLRDVRLALIAAHGDERGRAIYRELVLDSVRRVVPGLGGPTAFGTASHELLPHATGENFQQAVEAASLRAPGSGDPGEIETPYGSPNAHVVTVDEADSAIEGALSDGFSWSNFVVDTIGIVPFAGVAVRLQRVAVAAEKASWLANEAAGGFSFVSDAKQLLSPREVALPPGSREGDELVSWLASRQPVQGGPKRLYARTAVVRSGVLISQGIQALPAGTTTPEGHP
jgi:hypothetical protein